MRDAHTSPPRLEAPGHRGAPVRTTACLTGLLGLCGCLGSPSRTAVEEASAAVADRLVEDYLLLADRVVAWLDARATGTGDSDPRTGGIHWPVDETASSPRLATDLYSGSAGIVLFYLEHHHGRRGAGSHSLEMAMRAGEGLWTAVQPGLAKCTAAGLYTGMAGVAFTFAELYRTTGDATDRDRAVACVQAVLAAQRPDGSWSPSTDIISGTAGIGLALLRLDSDLELPAARAAAVRAGEQLLAMAEPVRGLRRWPMARGAQREMPNFSHGTAGVAFFLGRLYEVTREDRFLAAARDGADYLLSITDRDGLIYHNQLDKGLRYLSWCHGPAGTGRLFALLHRLTSDERYAAWIERAAAAIAATRIPHVATPGFWNNHGQCCGTAGVVDFFLHRRAMGGDRRFDARMEGMLRALQAAARTGADGQQVSWTGAEHRVRPGLLSTQTGYTQGAAGIGMVFLHAVAWRKGAPRRIVLPDSPYPRR